MSSLLAHQLRPWTALPTQAEQPSAISPSGHFRLRISVGATALTWFALFFSRPTTSVRDCSRASWLTLHTKVAAGLSILCPLNSLGISRSASWGRVVGATRDRSRPAFEATCLSALGLAWADKASTVLA